MAKKHFDKLRVSFDTVAWITAEKHREVGFCKDHVISLHGHGSLLFEKLFMRREVSGSELPPFVSLWLCLTSEALQFFVLVIFLDFKAKPTLADFTLCHSVVKFSAASKEQNEINIRHFPGSKSDIALCFNQLVKTVLLVKVVDHDDLLTAKNHAVAGESLDGQNI